jgi:uncharacterized protein YhfF
MTTMPIHDGALRFGYPGDAGVGAALESMVIAGTKTATCLPTGELAPSDAAETLGSSGRSIEVVDWDGRTRCRIVVTAAYEATFREPTRPLLAGEGYGADIGAFQRDHVAPPRTVDRPAAAALLTRIPRDLAAVVERHDVHRDPTNQIARELDLPIEVVRQRLRRGRVRLASALADRGGAGARADGGASPVASWATAEHVAGCEYCSRLVARLPSSPSGSRQPDELDLPIAVICFRLAD